MTALQPCPVDGCTDRAIASLVIARLPRVKPGVRCEVIACPAHWRAVGNGATVRVEIEPGDHARLRPRVRLNPPAVAATPIGHRSAPG